MSNNNEPNNNDVIVIEEQQNSKSKKTLTKMIVNITLNVVIVFLVLLLVLRLFLPDATLNILGVNMYVVATGSMEPDIRVRDTVIVRRINDRRFDRLETGDIIVFYADTSEGRRLVIHFFYDVDETGRVRTYSMQHVVDGEHNGRFDPVSWNVTRDRVIGTHMGTMRTAGLGATIRHPIFIVSMVVMVVGVIGLFWVLKKEDKEKNEISTDPDNIIDMKDVDPKDINFNDDNNPSDNK